MSTLITKLFRKKRIILPSLHLSQIVLSAVTSVFLIQYNTIQYNTTSFISNIEHNYTTTAIFTQYWDGWKGGGQKNNLIVVHPLSGLKSCRNMHPLPIHVSAKFHLDIIHSKQDMVIGIFHIWSNNFLAYQRFFD